MRQIRRGVFETNSSSTHSICISKEPVKHIPDSIHFSFGEYGWENDCVYDTASYLYTAMYELGMKDEIDGLKEILESRGIKCSFEQSKSAWDSGGVDHAGELSNLIHDLLSDEEKLMRYLFGSSVIYTGNDNCDENLDMCCCAEETIWDDDAQKMIPNPNYNPDVYDYYYKGN